jgi:hypothetical protein
LHDLDDRVEGTHKLWQKDDAASMPQTRRLKPLGLIYWKLHAYLCAFFSYGRF